MMAYETIVVRQMNRFEFECVVGDWFCAKMQEDDDGWNCSIPEYGFTVHFRTDEELPYVFDSNGESYWGPVATENC